MSCDAAANRRARLRARLGSAALPTGHDAIAQSLGSSGVTHVYSLPGTPMYATLGACIRHGLTVIGCRSQAGALSAALAHNFQAGQLCAVAICSPAPGVTNSLTALSDARANGWPLVLIGARILEDPDSPGPFQGFDSAAAAAPVSKAVLQIQDRATLPEQIRKAVQLASANPPGPIFVEITDSALAGQQQDPALGPLTERAPAPTPVAPSKHATQELLQQLSQAHRPLLVLGEGIRWSAASPTALRSQLEQLGLPVLASPMARGILADNHPLSIFAAQSQAFADCDLVLLCGADLDWRFGHGHRIRERQPVCALSPDLSPLIAHLPNQEPDTTRQDWCNQMARAHQEALSRLREQAASQPELAQMHQLIAALAQAAPAEAVTVIDSGLALAGSHMLWPAHHPFGRMTLGQNGTIGLGIPFALGAALQDPTRPVIALVGDVGFGLAAAELETALRTGACMTVVVADNGGINGRMFQDRWLPASSPDTLRYSPRTNYARIAQGWGVRSTTANTLPALHAALADVATCPEPQVIAVQMDGLTPPTRR